MARSQCIFAYNNLFLAGTLTASTEDADFPKENAVDWLTYDMWKTTAATSHTLEVDIGVSTPADCAFIYGHNLPSLSGSVKVQYWNGSTWVDASTATTPTDTNVIAIVFTEVSATKWRLLFTTSSGALEIVEAMIAKALEMPVGVWDNFSPPLLARDTEIMSNETDTGQFKGRSIIRYGFETMFDFMALPMDWVRTYWLPFVKHAEQKPFFGLWSANNYPAEAAYMWTDGKIEKPKNTHKALMSAGLKVRGKLGNDA